MMNERKRRMLDTALVLFSEKGYKATSIQEITEAWGISKGAFYNNFSSKEELMLSIMKYYTKLAFQQLQTVPAGPSEKETFIEEIRIQFSIVEKHKDIIAMHLKEQQFSEEIQHYMFAARAKIFNWYILRLKKVFGFQIEPYIFDCVILLLSMIHGYTSLIIIDQKPLQFEKTARFIVNRLESIVDHFGDEAPLLTNQLMKDFLQTDDEFFNIQQRINALRQAMSVEEEDLVSSLDTLEAEFAGGVPRSYMAESLLLYLKKHSREEWTEALCALEVTIRHYFQNHPVNC